MTRREHFQQEMKKPQTVSIIFLYLARLYRNQLVDKTDKKRRRIGLTLALQKICDEKTKAYSSVQ